MVPYALAVLVYKLRAADCGPVRPAGDELCCRCPAHSDNSPSLSLRAADGKVLVYCAAGCTAAAICDRLDHSTADLTYDVDESLVELDQEPDADATPSSPVPPIEPGGPPLASPATAVAVADENLRHRVYEGLLSRLELSTAHFEALRHRGLTADEITARGYRTADPTLARKAVDALLAEHGATVLLTVPGFARRYERVTFPAGGGLLIPVRLPDGRVVALKVRHDANAGSPKYTWASSREASCGNVAHVPLGVSVPSPTVRLTEGELKADVATALSGIPTVSAPGVAHWHAAVPALKTLDAKTVLLAMDQDGNPGTLAATEKALFGLTREGFQVALEWWDGTTKGIDDLLAAGGTPERVEGLAAAVRLREAMAPAATVLEDADPEPEPFPVDVFPPALATYCQEVAAATGTPPDFAGVTMLVTAGAAIGCSRALCLKDGAWYEAPRFYAACVGDPASVKTPAMEQVIRPYQALQMALLQEYRAGKEEYGRAEADHERSLKEYKALNEDERGDPPVPPEEPAEPERFVTGDATVESLAVLLERNPRGLLMPQDEGAAWVRGMGQYKGGRGNDRQFWLSAWSGRGHLVDRKSQGAVAVSIPRPFINVPCGLPPDMLGELADHQGRNDGFLHRVLFAFPRAAAGTDWTDETVSLASRQTWETTLAGLRRLPMVELDDGLPGHRAVHLSAAARDAWVRWWDAHAAELRGEELPVGLIGPWGKLRSYAARLTLVLHYLWLVQGTGDEGDVEAVSVERAAQMVGYFKSHLRLVYGRLGQTTEDNRLLEVLDWVRKSGGRCTARDLVRARKATPTDQAKRVLKELHERGYGRLDQEEAANRRKVTVFVLDPV
jgi:Protein of unknown function (DUF3987)/Domain of unknown function (DUF3854)